MKHSHLLPVLAVLLVPACCFADATFKLGDATLTVNDRGCVTSLKSADGKERASATAPAAFSVTTTKRVLYPSQVSRKGDRLTVNFGEHGRIQLAVTEARGFAVLKLTELSVSEPVERLQLFCLPVDRKEKQIFASMINAVYDESFAMAVMATEVNVHAKTSVPQGSDSKNCSHRFEPAGDDAKQGKFAAKFTATSERSDGAGWSVVGKGLSTPLDLSGCTGLRAWVCGDGSGQLLKIQLVDGQGGYRDDYVKIDFTGWRQVELKRPQLNTLHNDHVVRVSFYFNSLPSKKTVSCRIDQVEAIIGEGDKAKSVTLEDFENTASELWGTVGTTLLAETVKQFGIQPAGVGIIACPREKFPQTIERFERAAGLPSPHPGGVWGKRSPWKDHSYLFVTRFTENDTDDVITFGKRGGFDMILIEQSSWCSSTGHYQINTNAFPRGLDGLRATLARLKKAGFKVGLHYLGPSIYPPDPYLTPKPDSRLVRDAFGELAGNVDAKSDFVPTIAAPKGFPAEDGGYTGKGAVIQIGDELIRYRERSMEPPYGFRGCTRGLHGTQAAAHQRGDRISHLLKSYGYFLFDIDSTLMDEVATNLARVANACNVDMLYWDGSERLQGEHWYYNPKMQKAFYDRLKNKNVFLQGSSYNHYSWHWISRCASADGHGDLKGYLDERTPGFASYQANLMPLDVGWYYVYDTKTTTDQFEYVLNKSLGFNSSISLQTSPKHIREHPYIGEIVDLVGAYERLRLSGKVPEETRAKLREPQRDYHLVTVNGKQVLQRIVYEPWPWREVAALDGKQNVWEYEVKEGVSRIGVDMRIARGQWVQPGPSYRSDKSVLLEDFASLKAYIGGTRQGVTQKFEPSADGPESSKPSAVYTATSTLGAKDGWSCMQRTLNPPKDISTHKGIGFWLRGDGRGGQFKLQLRDGRGAMDYYVPNDYAGWRYQQLARPERDTIDYSHVTNLAFYYNGLPATNTVQCAIAEVRALPSLDQQSLRNPQIEIGDRNILWPVTLQEGQSLEWRSDDSNSTCRVGVEKIASPASLKLAPGKYKVKFSTGSGLETAVSVRINAEPPEQLALEKGQ